MALRYAVVGGGVSGTRAALTLARAGLPVTLYEKNARLGGRAFSFPTADFGEVDVGQHIWLRACTEFEGFLAELGVPAGWVHRQERVAMTYRWADGRSHAFAVGPGFGPLASLLALARMPGLTWPEKASYAAASALAARYTPATLLRLDRTSAARWLRRLGQPEAVTRTFWEPFLVGVCNAPLDEVSAYHALTLLRTTLLASPEASAICLLRVPLSAVFDRLARDALSAAGVVVARSSPVRAVLPGAPPSLRLADGSEQACAGVVVAVPARVRAALLPGVPSPPLPAEEPIAGLLVRFAAPVMGEPFFTAVGSPVQHVFNRTWVRGDREPDGTQVVELVLSAAADYKRRDATLLARELLPHLARHLPQAGTTPALAWRKLVHGAATFAVAPGAEAGRRRLCSLAIPGVALAGDHAAPGLPSTLEAAAWAGRNAARTFLGGAGRMPSARGEKRS